MTDSCTGVSTSKIFAPGAIACDHSTSSVVSAALATIPGFFGLNGGTLPTGCSTRNAGGAGSPKARSKTRRSCRMVGDPNGSTITIVRPLPVRPFAYSGGRL